MRVAVIGCGSIGRRHIGNLLALGCEVSVYDVDTERAKSVASEFGVEAIKEAIAADAWVIATPYDKHLSWVLRAVAANLPFFVEKPLGSLDQLPHWWALAALDLPVNQVGYMLRFHPIAQAMKFTNPTSGDFGVRCDMATWPGRAYGPVDLELSHELDLALWLGFAGVQYADDIIALPSGKTLFGGDWLVEWNGAAGEYRRRWRVKSEGGYITYQFHSPEELGTDMYRAEMAHFLDCVREQKPTLCPLVDGLRVLEVCAQIEALTKAPS